MKYRVRRRMRADGTAGHIAMKYSKEGTYRSYVCTSLQDILGEEANKTIGSDALRYIERNYPVFLEADTLQELKLMILLEY